MQRSGAGAAGGDEWSRNFARRGMRRGSCYQMQTVLRMPQVVALSPGDSPVDRIVFAVDEPEAVMAAPGERLLPVVHR
jgi:hypothetical protein